MRMVLKKRMRMQHQERKEKAKARDDQDLKAVLLVVVILERVEHFAMRERKREFVRPSRMKENSGTKGNTHVMYGPSSLYPSRA